LLIFVLGEDIYKRWASEEKLNELS